MTPGMDPFSSRARRFARPGALVLAATAALATPTAASAKTFVSHIPDATGDAKQSSHDIKTVRVAYNRRTGALSATLTVAGKIDTSSSDGFAVLLSNLDHGKCTAPVLLIVGEFNDPTHAAAARMNSAGIDGKQYAGEGSVDGGSFSARVKSRSLAGKTVGCAAAVVINDVPKGQTPTVFDRTKGNDGFFG